MGEECYVDICIARSTEMASVGLLFSATFHIQQKSEFFASQWVPNASTSSVHPRLCALCSYSCVYLLVLLFIFGWLPHHCPFLELGPMTQIP